MNLVKILKIIIILLQLIASGIDTESAIAGISSKYNISSAFLRKFL
ncbi:hypothetical protein GNF83_17475 [Clostridium perfringens]|uniref:Uncharacterized protein n=1 Tax=Clostridium perfringens TaxID=1502 RepID=A0AAW9K5D4_CLOPF|nr:hypothetical protein [Clostridium perfringens]